MSLPEPVAGDPGPKLEVFTITRPTGFSAPAEPISAPEPVQPAAGDPAAPVYREAPNVHPEPSMPAHAAPTAAAPQADPAEPEEDFDFDAPADLVARSNESAAARRISNRERDEALRERDELRAWKAENENRIIGRKEIDEFNALDTAREQAVAVAQRNELALAAHEHYVVSLEAKRRQEKAAGTPEEELPVYDRDFARQYVQQQVAARMQPAPAAPADIAKIVRTEIQRAQSEGAEKFKQVREHEQVTQRDATWKAEMAAAIKADPTGAVKRIARASYQLAKQEGFKTPAQEFVRQLTGIDRAVAPLATAARAEHARRDVPLSHKGSARPPQTGNDILARIERERMEPADLFAALDNGTASLR